MAGADQLPLPDGRRLDIQVSGDPADTPLVFHHGTPGAATAFRGLERAAHQRGLCVVRTSRPGYGGSDRNPGRRVVDVAADIAAVLEALDKRRCLVAGWSGGGPHALACAARLKEVAAVLVIAGVAPYPAEGGDLDWMAGMGEENVTEFGFALGGEDRLRSYLDGVREHLLDVTPAGIVTSLATLLPAVDRAVLTDELGEDMAASFHEGLRTGVDGWLDDDLAFTTEWGFDLAEISVPVLLWQGSADLMVPFAHGQWLASRIPGVAAHLEADEGHLSITVGAIGRMLDELVAVAAQGQPGPG